MTYALDMVRGSPCIVCGSKADPHHVTTRGAGGGDTIDNLMPLCRTHHTEWHKSGPGRMIEKYMNVLKWLTDHGRDDVLRRAGYRT